MKFVAALYFTPLLLLKQTKPTAADQAPIIQFFYWNVDPFLSLNVKRGKVIIKGTIADSFKLAALHCRRPSYNTANNCSSRGKQTSSLHENISANSQDLRTRKFIEYIKVGIGHQRFHDVIFAPDRLSKLQQPVPQYRIDCDRPLLQIWGVLFMDKSDEWIDLRLKNLTTFRYTTSEKLALLMPRKSILAVTKILDGISNCAEPIFLSVIFALIFGSLIWFSEHQQNDDISENFASGIQDAVWCCFVTMTTIGYGDVYPKTFIGKLIMWVWITIGLLLIAVMCGNVYMSVDSPPDIFEKRIAVQPNTTAERYARDYLGATVIHAGTYRKLFKKVENSEADAALMNSDVYSVYQRFMGKQIAKEQPLHVVQEYDVEQPILMAFQNEATMSRDAKELFECMTIKNKKLIFDIPVLQHPTQCRVETVYSSKLSVHSFLLLFLATLALLAVCVAYGFCLDKIQIRRCVQE